MKSTNSLYTVSFDVRFPIGYADGIRDKLYRMFDAFKIYGLRIVEHKTGSEPEKE